MGLISRIFNRGQGDGSEKNDSPVENYIATLPVGRWYVIAIQERGQAVTNAETLVKGNFLQHYPYRIFPIGVTEALPGMWGSVITLADRCVLVIGGITDACAMPLYVERTSGARIVKEGSRR